MDAPYLRTYRRMLLDMHIPDWDESFLTNYDPQALAKLYERADASAVMLYCNSHVGLTNYPAAIGKMHPGLGGTDVVGELTSALRDRDIRTCAYYSVLFDNWAVGEHPEWWISPIRDPSASSGGQGGPLPRYGICCPNNEPYVAFTEERIAELLARFDFDCLFFDMTFWAVICGCDRCRERYTSETGSDIPEIVDWTSPEWCAFQTAREDWMRGFVQRIVDAAKNARPEMPVYNNFAFSISTWTTGFDLQLANEVDFLGGDMYGDRTEQLVVSKLMLNLSENRPAEFMTSLCVNLRDHVRLRSADDLRMKAFAAAAHSSACLFIDAIDPDGSVDPARYDLVGSVFDRVAPYEPFLGGDPVEDVAVYHSSESRMSFDENGTHVGSHGSLEGRTPHQRALRGACRMLQQAHLPFGVITRKQLDSLDRYAVVVLPNVLRMDNAEVDAFREFVRRGGRLYASGYTSLTSIDGVRRDDFMLSDVFGCSFEGEETGSVLFCRAEGEDMAALLAPQRYVSATGRSTIRLPGVTLSDGRVLAELSIAYGHPNPGTVFDQHWSSIHSWPPHTDTDSPAIVEHAYGDGACIYSSFDLEATDADVNDRVFVGLVKRLLRDDGRYEAETHASVWVTVFDQPERSRMTVSFVNYAADLPAVPVVGTVLRLRAPEGATFIGLVRAPDSEPVDHLVDGGMLTATIDRVDEFAMLVATYRREDASEP